MKKKEMRLQFNDDDLKGKLEDLASDLDISLNMLVNMMLSSHFSDKEKKSFQLMVEIAEFKTVQEVS